MPWCPVCKNEYREGVTVCADCGVDLVDELVEEVKKAVAAYMDDEAQALKYIDYLKYSGIEADLIQEDTHTFNIYVNESDLAKAKLAYKAYVKSESEIFEETLSKATDVEKQAYMKVAAAQAEMLKPAGVYVSQSETAKDMSATSKTFFVFAVLLAVFDALCYFKVLPIFNGQLSVNIVLACMSLGCLLVGISSMKRAKIAKANSSAEENQTKLIESWLDENADSILNDPYNPVDTTLPKELLYLERADRLKEALEKQFGRLDTAYVETIIDAFYDKTFGA